MCVCGVRELCMCVCGVSELCMCLWCERAGYVSVV